MSAAIQFLFILTLPIVLVLGGLVTLFAVGALFDALDNMDELRQRIDGAFRGGPREPRPISAAHYYQPYWR